MCFHVRGALAQFDSMETCNTIICQCWKAEAAQYKGTYPQCYEGPMEGVLQKSFWKADESCSIQVVEQHLLATPRMCLGQLEGRVRDCGYLRCRHAARSSSTVGR